MERYQRLVKVSFFSLIGPCECLGLLPSPVPAIFAAGGYLLRIWYLSAIIVKGDIKIKLTAYRTRSAV